MTTRQARIMQSVKTIFVMLSPLHVGSADIPFMACACNLGFMISDNMTLDKHMSNVCCSAYVKTGSIHQYLTLSNQNLVCTFVPSKFDYCNSFLSSFTFSADYRKFRTLQRTWFSKHANLYNPVQPLQVP